MTGGGGEGVGKRDTRRSSARCETLVEETSTEGCNNPGKKKGKTPVKRGRGISKINTSRRRRSAKPVFESRRQ